MIHFLSGLPRSGSTLLSNILAQNPLITATATSGVIDLLGALIATYENNPALLSTSKGDAIGLLKAVLNEKYKNRPIVIDKSRGWVRPGVIETMTDVLGYQPKIIATVRPIADCVASFVRLVKPDDINQFVKTSPLIEHLKFSYEALNAGFATYPESILFVEYDKLVSNPAIELQRIYDFLELPTFIHTYDAIESIVVEDDEAAWGIKDLHTIRPIVAKIAPPAIDVLGNKLHDYFDVPECWNPTKPVKPRIKLLDEALALALNGDFANAETIVDIALSLDSKDNRALFNKGWYELGRGNLKKGMELIACGRHENVFGSPPPSGMPMWTGEDLAGKTVLLNLEGGLGDQICNARFATNLAGLGAKVVLGGDAGLAATLMQIDGVTAYAESTCAGGVYHDYYVPSMSAPLLLGLEYDDLSGKAYLPSVERKRGDKLRVGLRWAGNPQFEHEQHRRFDPVLMFGLTDFDHVEFISLQRDSDVAIPSHIAQPDLSTWEATRRAIESCDLVISSCTSVAHMAAAMGKPTWIIVPILPYYLWALPGATTPWYDSVRLFRQTKKGFWVDVFERIYLELEKLSTTTFQPNQNL